MGVSEIVTILVEQRDRLTRAIDALGGGGQKRRGRPPGSGTRVAPPAKPVPTEVIASGGRSFTQEQRERQSSAMKAYWARRRRRH